jgi:hypothetical protein
VEISGLTFYDEAMQAILGEMKAARAAHPAPDTRRLEGRVGADEAFPTRLSCPLQERLSDGSADPDKTAHRLYRQELNMRSWRYVEFAASLLRYR